MVHFQAMMFLKTVRKISPLLKIQKAVKSVCLILLCPNDFFLWKYFILNTIFKTFFIFYLNITIYIPRGFPGGTGGKEPACPCRRHGFNPWIRKIPWRRTDCPLQYSCWRIPWTEAPGGLWFMGSQRVRHNWSSLACMHTFIPNQSNVL